MANPNSRLILCKGINLDKNHLNVLDYSESAMVSLCESKAIFSQNDAQFIRETGKIVAKCTYAQAKQANYLAFQNPAYSNKWTFAFKDSERYVSDSAVEISFTEDFFATWFSYFSLLECYVIREHAANDAIGANIVPEDFSFNNLDMILYANQSIQIANSLVYCVAINGEPGSSNPVLGGVYGGVPCGYAVIPFSTFAAFKSFITHFYDEPDKITAIYLVPREFFNENDIIYDIDPIQLPLPAGDNTGFSVEYEITPITPTFDGYTPVNNKLYTYPYCFSKLVNNLGSYMVFAQERFDGNPNFRTVGGNAATSCMITFPTNYKKGAGVVIPMEDNISINSFPTGGWLGSAVGQWQANNGIMTAVNTIGGIGAAAVGLAGMTNPITAPLALAGVVNSAANTIGNLANTQSQLEHAANPVKGGANNIAGLLALGEDALKPRYESYCINAQLARIIDDYFTKYGYATKQIKTPNISGHANQNYIQVQGAAVKGDLPGRVCDEINSLFNRGIHIWHSHDNIGNF